MAANPVVHLRAEVCIPPKIQQSHRVTSLDTTGCSWVISDGMDVLEILNTAFSHVGKPRETPPARLHSWHISWHGDQDAQLCFPLRGLRDGSSILILYREPGIYFSLLCKYLTLLTDTDTPVSCRNRITFCRSLSPPSQLLIYQTTLVNPLYCVYLPLPSSLTVLLWFKCLEMLKKKSLRDSHLQSWWKWIVFVSAPIYTRCSFVRAAGIPGGLAQVQSTNHVILKRSGFLQPGLVYELSLGFLLLLLGDSLPGKENEEMLEKYPEVFQMLNQLFACSCYVLQKSLVVRSLSLSTKWAEKSHCVQRAWALTSEWLSLS